jgi:hypothetical protein
MKQFKTVLALGLLAVLIGSICIPVQAVNSKPITPIVFKIPTAVYGDKYFNPVIWKNEPASWGFDVVARGHLLSPLPQGSTVTVAIDGNPYHGTIYYNYTNSGIDSVEFLMARSQTSNIAYGTHTLVVSFIPPQYNQHDRTQLQYAPSNLRTTISVMPEPAYPMFGA